MSDWMAAEAEKVEEISAALAFMDSTDHDQIEDYLESCLGANENALMYYCCFEYDKSVLPADHSVLDLDPTERDWWEQAMEKGGLIYTDPYVDAASGQMIVSIANPATIGGETAVILADIAIDTLVATVDSFAFSDHMSAFLLTADGSVIAHPNTEYLPKEEGNTKLTDCVDVSLATGGISQYTDYDGTDKYVSVSEVAETD